MHPIRFAKTTGAYFGAALLATVAVACNDPTVINYCMDRPECFLDGASDTSVKRDAPLPPDGVVADTGPSRSPLCGLTGCFPDNPSSCGSATFQPPTRLARVTAEDDASPDGVSTADGAADAGVDAASDAADARDATKDTCHGDRADDAAEPDVSEDAPEPDATEDTAAEPEPDVIPDTTEPPPTADASSMDSGGDRRDATDGGVSEEPKIVQGCYLKPATIGVVTECAPVGPGAEGSACSDSHECGPQLACVEVDQQAACRRITCFLPPDCLKGTYYQEAPLRVNGRTRFDLNVPACLPTDNCTLLDPVNHCPSGKVCTVVGNDGDTTCLVPGSAKVGEGCETSACAEGLLCSKFSNQCVKICHVGSADSGSSECPSSTCQGGNRSLPDGFGICIGQIDGG
jgi:hypothetical protein